jgi:alkaline phosphatase D
MQITTPMRLLALLLFLSASVANAQSFNLSPDSAHAPFIYGVASGDPTVDGVLIWSATQPADSLHGRTINWQLGTDSLFATSIATGTYVLDSSWGYTATVDVTGLQPATRYYYRFSMQGSNSVTGVTYTAPTGSLDSIPMALVSCSSLFSGYFNAYRQLARLPLKALIHVGDYIYDFVDGNEQVRMPPEALIGPRDTVTEDWRARHRLYLTDPDLREARRLYPWICTWDNHDVARSNPGKSSRAYREFVPFRQDPSDSIRIWRKVSYGQLLDIFMIDINLVNNNGTFTSGSPKAMSDAQFNWLKAGLKNSTATWKLIGSEKLFSPWDLGGLPLPGGGLSRTWNGYPQSRDSLLIHLRDNQINNTVILSGDFHMNIWSDVPLNPFDSLAYSRATGAGSLAIEIMGTSVSRGNLDESGLSPSFQTGLQSSSLQLNPQQRYLNLYDHGFNTFTLSADSLVAKSYLCPILTKTDSMLLEAVWVSKAGENHWQRPAIATGITAIEPAGKLQVYPNPSATGLFTVNTAGLKGPLTLTVCDLTGRQLLKREVTGGSTYPLNTQALPTGSYILYADGKKVRQSIKLLVP